MNDIEHLLMQNLTYSNDLLKNIKTNFEKFLFYIVML